MAIFEKSGLKANEKGGAAPAKHGYHSLLLTITLPLSSVPAMREEESSCSYLGRMDVFHHPVLIPGFDCVRIT